MLTADRRVRVHCFGVPTRLCALIFQAERIRINRFGDANGRCSAFEVRRRFRSSAQFMPRCTTNSIRSATRHEASLQAKTLCCLRRVARSLSTDRPSRDGGRAACRRASVTLTPPSRAPQAASFRARRSRRDEPIDDLQAFLKVLPLPNSASRLPSARTPQVAACGPAGASYRPSSK